MRNVKKITSILIIASITMVMFIGCSSKKSDATAQTRGNGQMGNRNFDPAAIKTRYENALKSLVTAGTITQEQSDKVLEAVTKNVPQSGNQGMKGSDKTSGNGKPNEQQNNQQGQQKGTGSGLGGPRNSQLNTLITSGVITQPQADAINQKVQETMKNNANNQPTQN
ncbi:MAG: hypothetical protein H7Y18_20610 [Clostridiaceae bacterium]|nr:hypothetical protein [Clostridiaceae bacterium]